MQRDISLQTYATWSPNRVLHVAPDTWHSSRLKYAGSEEGPLNLQFSVSLGGTCYKFYHKCGQSQWIKLPPGMTQVKYTQWTTACRENTK